MCVCVVKGEAFLREKYFYLGEWCSGLPRELAMLGLHDRASLILILYCLASIYIYFFVYLFIVASPVRYMLAT